MGIDTRLLLRMPSTLSLEDCFGEWLRLALAEMPEEQRGAMKAMMLTGVGPRLADGTLVFHSNVHFAPPRQALERGVADMLNALGAEGAAVRDALAGIKFEPAPEFKRALGDFRARGGVEGAFERFREAVAEELVGRFGASLKEMHDDARGVLAFPELVEMHASTYDAAVAQVEPHGVWLPFPPTIPQ
ncbi:hypothetical protein AKJ09_06747 [Labilithrix luteola]|uniref:Uncharacterized protein n=1 Tax=Labilithrix luteola TaxID=1391654 RepID=A0A0K1Q2T9_9BACT|nr:hypothetical protein [Labilithrix luteola]AKV00084.1 hypothetical protein AKJ09_06747 [Labilithrix luteola]